MPDLTGEQITDILRRRSRRSRTGGAHFKVGRHVLDVMRRQPAPPPPPLFGAPQLGNLLGIPIVVDETLPDGAWELVENSTREVLHAGTLDSLEAGDA